MDFESLESPTTLAEQNQQQQQQQHQSPATESDEEQQQQLSSSEPKAAQRFTETHIDSTINDDDDDDHNCALDVAAVTVAEQHINELEQLSPKKHSPPTAAMEFTKNYSDDLLGQERSLQPIEADLAEFELSNRDSPEAETYLKSFEPIAPRKSSVASSTAARTAEPASTATTTTTSSSQPTTSTSETTSQSAPDFKALKECLVAHFEQFSDIFYWKKPVVSGTVLASGMSLLLALMYLSIISVVANTALGIIFVSGIMRLYRAVMSALNKSSETPFDHIWDKALDIDVSISSSSAQKITNSINALLTQTKNVLLVEEKISTLKFGSFLFALTFLGSWFNGLTLLTLAYLALFTVPIVYKQNKIAIDSNFQLVSNQVSSVTSNVTCKFSSMIGSSNNKLQQQQQSPATSKKDN